MGLHASSSLSQVTTTNESGLVSRATVTAIYSDKIWLLTVMKFKEQQTLAAQQLPHQQQWGE
jgi:hypothetical protein